MIVNDAKNSPLFAWKRGEHLLLGCCSLKNMLVLLCLELFFFSKCVKFATMSIPASIFGHLMVPFRSFHIDVD